MEDIALMVDFFVDKMISKTKTGSCTNVYYFEITNLSSYQKTTERMVFYHILVDFKEIIINICLINKSPFLIGGPVSF